MLLQKLGNLTARELHGDRRKELPLPAGSLELRQDSELADVDQIPIAELLDFVLFKKQGLAGGLKRLDDWTDIQIELRGPRNFENGPQRNGVNGEIVLFRKLFGKKAESLPHLRAGHDQDRVDS